MPRCTNTVAIQPLITPQLSIKQPRSIVLISIHHPSAHSPLRFSSKSHNVKQNSIKARPPSNPPSPPFIIFSPSQPSSNQTSPINKTYPRSSSELPPSPGLRYCYFQGQCQDILRQQTKQQRSVPGIRRTACQRRN